MKIGGGFSGLMSKSNIECSSRGRWPFLYTAALVLLGLTLTLTGCGELSLNQLLENQEPGELGITPKMIEKVDTDSSFEVAGIGGFKPYTFSATAGSFEETDGIIYYKAPSSATPEVTITLADRFASEATMAFEIVSSGGLSFPQEMTVEIGGNTGFLVATGGSGSYDFWIEGDDGNDGWLEFHGILDDRVKYHADVTEEMIVLVTVKDLDTLEQRTLTITIVEDLGG
jgi:hypothetical protein